MGESLSRFLYAVARSAPWRRLIAAARSRRPAARVVMSALRVIRLILFVPGVEIGFDGRVGPRCRFLCAPDARIVVRNCDLASDVTLDADAGATLISRPTTSVQGPRSPPSGRSSSATAAGWLTT
jgi:hypothetical protein